MAYTLLAGQVGTHYGTEWLGADAGKWIGLGSGLVAGFGTSGGLNRIFWRFSSCSQILNFCFSYSII
ncbi:MAG: hypothetical protein WAX04_11850 [Oscillospiraceae bacterium]